MKTFQSSDAAEVNRGICSSQLVQGRAPVILRMCIRLLSALSHLASSTVICLFLFCEIAAAATTSSLSKWGITWTFAGAVEYGTFANGDYWVVGPVTINAMTPDWDGTLNGWEINPTVQTSQGFVAGVSGYDALLRPAMPFTMTSGSLVKTIGQTPTVDGSNIKTAAVLTVLTEVPPGNGAGVFRPPYVGTNKPIYLVSNIRQDLLPTGYAPVANMPTLATVTANFSKCLRMDHRPSTPRWFRPTDAMKGYQPNNTQEINEAMLRLMMMDSYADKLPALIQFTQHTIDQAYAVLYGYRNSDDGHNPNHRVMAAWAATLLDISAVKTLLATATGFHEDLYLYSANNRVLWGESGYSEFSYWNYIMTGSGSRSLKEPYGYIDGGKLSSVGASYQNIVSQSFKGQALIYRLFPQLRACIPITQRMNLDNYAERWITHGVWASPDPVAPYDGVNSNYGITFGPNGTGGYIPGSGRFTQYHGANKDGGQYKSLFVASMWSAYAGTTSAPTPPSGLRIMP